MRANRNKLKGLLNLSSKMVPALILSLAVLNFAGGRVSAASATTSGVYIMPSPNSDGDAVINIDSGSHDGAIVFTVDTSAICDTATISRMRVQWKQDNVPGPGAPMTNTSDGQGLGGYFFHSSSPSNTLDIDTYNNTPAGPSAYGFGFQWSTEGVNSLVDIEYDLTGYTRSEIDSLAAFNSYTYVESAMVSQGLDPADYPFSFIMRKPVITFTYDDSSCPSSNSAPTISGSTSQTGSNTAAGTVLVPGSSLAASDPDGDSLTYSITSGNDGGYFAIDSTSGNLTTTQTGIPAGTYTLTIQVDDGNGGTATSTVTVTVTDSAVPALYCPSPYDTNQLLSPTGDCDGDGISNQAEGFDPDGDGNPSTGAAPLDTDKDGVPDYLDLDSDNDGILDSEEKGTGTTPVDTDSDGTPDFQDLDSDNDGATDLTESGRSYTDANSDGVVDGSINTYGLAASAVSSTNAQTYSLSSFKDSDGNGTPDFRQATSKNSLTSLANTGTNLSLILALALTTSIAALSLKKFSKR